MQNPIINSKRQPHMRHSLLNNMQQLRPPNDLQQILCYLRSPASQPYHQSTAELKKCTFVLSMLGKLLIEDYRMVQFLSHDTFLMQSMAFWSNTVSYVVKVMERNSMADDRNRRLQVLEEVRGYVERVRGEGVTRVLLLYVDNASYSELGQEQLKQDIAPVVHYLKHQQPLPKSGRKPLKANEVGIKLHSLVQKYIQGVGQIRNTQFLTSLKPFNLRYDLNLLLNTINYIIGREMLQGGYQIIGCQKPYRISLTPLNYNRLDLLLRSKDKVLVIDWKFSVWSANDYIKWYVKKVYKYLKIAKMQYDCEVEFHLYCVHRYVSRQSSWMYRYTMKQVFLPVNEVVVLSDDEEEEGVEIPEEPDDEEHGQGQGPQHWDDEEVVKENRSQVVQVTQKENKTEGLKVQKQQKKSQGEKKQTLIEILDDQ